MHAANRSTTLRATSGDCLKQRTQTQQPTSSECVHYTGACRYGCVHIVMCVALNHLFFLTDK